MNPHDHTRWLNESDDIDAIRRRKKEQDERWNSPEDFRRSELISKRYRSGLTDEETAELATLNEVTDPVAAANQRIMADLGKALDKALPTPEEFWEDASKQIIDALAKSIEQPPTDLSPRDPGDETEEHP